MQLADQPASTQQPAESHTQKRNNTCTVKITLSFFSGLFKTREVRA